MRDPKHETLSSIFEAISPSNENIFGMYASFIVFFHLALKKVKNWKWFLLAYFPLCNASNNDGGFAIIDYMSKYYEFHIIFESLIGMLEMFWQQLLANLLLKHHWKLNRTYSI